MRVEMIHFEEYPYGVEIKDAFELRKDRGWVWLQKLCFWVLRKIGAYGIINKVERKTVRVDDFMEKVFRQYEDVERYFSHKPKRLLIGSEDFSNLTRNPMIAHYFHFDAEYNCNRTVHGLRVEVVPWMKGMVVL